MREKGKRYCSLSFHVKYGTVDTVRQYGTHHRSTNIISIRLPTLNLLIAFKNELVLLQ